MEIKIFKKTFKISRKDIVVIIPIIISIFSLIYAYNANILSNRANLIAEDSNNISLTILSHQESIEESDIRVGTYSSGKNKLNRLTQIQL